MRNPDDVTLLWVSDSGEEVEFVQVKSNEFDQLWSIAKLLEKEKEGDEPDCANARGKYADNVEAYGSGKAQDEPVVTTPKKSKQKDGQCLLEKSLQYDRCKEPVPLRIVSLAQSRMSWLSSHIQWG